MHLRATFSALSRGLMASALALGMGAVAAPSVAWAQAARSSAEGDSARHGPRKAPRPSWPVERFILPNGLRVVLAPDATLPSIAVSVVYDVGSRHEERGRTGFAHLFEHMMFQGSANVARGDHFKWVTAKGGLLNGTTNADRTAYYELLPKSELAFGLWLEADRMKSLDVSPENFENQRAVVQEELRMRIDNQPYVPAEMRLQELVYQGYFPYEHPEIGSMRDLLAARFEWVKAFHDAYYGPNNVVLAVAGDFDPKEAKAHVERLFGPIPKKVVRPFDAGAVPEQTQPRDAVITDEHAAFRAIMDGWAIPASHEADHPALDVTARILADGESSRLVRYLVRERGLASEIECGVGGRRGPDVFYLSAKLAGPRGPAEASERARFVASGKKTGGLEALGKAIDVELARLAKDGPTEQELERVRARIVAQATFGLESPHARAERLAEFEIYRGDARVLFDEADRLLAVSKDDVRRVVTRHLTRDRRSRVEVRPTSAPNADAEK